MFNIWGIHYLAPHPLTPSGRVERVSAQIIAVDPESVMIEYAVTPTGSLVLPPIAKPARADGLWRTTCFEAILKSADSDTYVELNFAPSLEWAAYVFDGYRTGMRPLAFQIDPEIEISDPEPISEDDPMWSPDPPDYFFLSAEFDALSFLSKPIRLGLSTVIEEKDGTTSYWALAHPPGEPDFHHPDCFALELPAPPPA